MNLLRYAFIALFAGALSGCWIVRPEPLDLSGYQKQTQETLQLFLSEISQSTDKIQSFRAMGKIKIRRSLGVERLRSAFVFKRPDQLRVDFYDDAIHRLLLLVVIKDNQVKAFDTQEKIVMVGSASPDVLAQLLRVPLSPEEIMLWFCGRLLLPDNLAVTDAHLYRNSQTGDFVLQVPGTEERQNNVFLRCLSADDSSCYPEIVKIQVYDNKTREIVVTTEYTYGGKEQGVPVSLKVSLPREKVTMTLALQNVDVNPDPKTFVEGLFQFNIPEGAEVKELD